RAVRYLAVPAGRSAQARCTGAGPDEAHPNDSRAPLMARVSFVGVKRVGIAVAWVVLFTLVSGGLTFGISEIMPGWGGQTWAVARIGAFEVIGFGLATLIVGRLLNKYSWDRMGWRRSVWPQLGRGALLGVAMADRKSV